MTFPSDAFPLDDRGLLLGDGLFETLLWTGGGLAHLDAHLARMSAGCQVLGLPAFDPVEARALCLAAPGEAGLGEVRAAVRLTLTAGSGGRGLDRPAAPVLRLAAHAAAAPPVTTPVDLVLAKTRRNEGSPAARLKTLSYLDNVLARAEAKAAGADEAVMRNNHGDLTCAAAANLFWVAEGRLFTPALHCGVLNGIARGRVLEAARTPGRRGSTRWRPAPRPWTRARGGVPDQQPDRRAAGPAVRGRDLRSACPGRAPGRSG
jgi:branched-subunit amino acid aminotransferase/4-amino-4-deoxychorismate lyase